MIQEIIFPISWEGWYKQDELVNSYYDVEFTEKYGIFEKGEKFSSICIDYGKGIIEAYNNEGTDIIKTQKFKTIPL